MRFVGASKNATEQAVPDVVQSLLGAGEKVADDDLNARETYYEYLEEKYKWHVCFWGVQEGQASVGKCLM